MRWNGSKYDTPTGRMEASWGCHTLIDAVPGEGFEPPTNGLQRPLFAPKVGSIRGW